VTFGRQNDAAARVVDEDVDTGESRQRRVSQAFRNFRRAQIASNGFDVVTVGTQLASERRERLGLDSSQNDVRVRADPASRILEPGARLEPAAVTPKQARWSARRSPRYR